MKNHNQNIFITAFLIFITVSGFSQTQKSTTPKSSHGTTNSSNSKKVETSSPGFQLDENDPYQGRKSEFLNQIIVPEIPVDFPKYEKWMGVRHYNEVIEDYYKKHPDILKESVKNKLLRN